MRPEEIIARNLSALDSRQASLCERRLAHIGELARLVWAAGDDEKDNASRMEAVRAAYRSIVGDGIPRDSYGDVIEQNRGSADNLYELLSCFDRVALCRAMTGLSGWNMRPEDFFPQDASPMRNRISYLRNAYADTAYSRFAEVLRDPTVTYCDDFNGVCEDVYYGRAGMCILPVENSGEGRLAAFGNLISKYDLKIVLACRVTSPPSGADTKFALLKKNVERLQLIDDAPRSGYFEFILTLPERGAVLSDILYSASCFGLKLCKADSIPVSYADTEYAHSLLFCIDGAELSGFLCYLSLEAPQFTPVGIYDYLL